MRAMVAQTPTHASETLTTRLEVTGMVDADSDGLIEIYNLTMLHNIRHNLAGTSYKNAGSARGVTAGCPANTCSGYELMSDLDFNRDGDSRTWDSNTYALDVGDNQTPYFIAANGGWQPIGVDNTAPFTAIFEGNGFVIRNLAIRRPQPFIGLFGATTGTIRNLGLEQALADKTGSSGANIGLLAGVTIGGGTIINSYATGVAAGDTSGDNFVGGLVGRLNVGTITASYAHASLFGEGGTGDGVGGLVGYLLQGDIIASYATGAVNGGPGNRSYTGGLVGVMGNTGQTTNITASYATGNANGGRILRIWWVAWWAGSGASVPLPPAMPRATPMAGLEWLIVRVAWWAPRLPAPLSPVMALAPGRATKPMALTAASPRQPPARQP